MQPGFADGLNKSAVGGSATNASLAGIAGPGGSAGLSPAAIDSILSGRSGIPPELIAAGLAKNNANPSDQVPPNRRLTTAHGGRLPTVKLPKCLRCAWCTAQIRTPIFHRSTTCTYRLRCARGHLEAFGLEVFRNSSNQPDVVPMDLPVGPGLRRWSRRRAGHRFVGRHVATDGPHRGPTRPRVAARSGAPAGQRTHARRSASGGTAGVAHAVPRHFCGCFTLEIADGPCVRRWRSGQPWWRTTSVPFLRR